MHEKFLFFFTIAVSIFRVLYKSVQNLQTLQACFFTLNDILKPNFAIVPIFEYLGNEFYYFNSFINFVYYALGQLTESKQIKQTLVWKHLKFFGKF